VTFKQTIAQITKVKFERDPLWDDKSSTHILKMMSM